jgi:hypothetical protein
LNIGSAGRNGIHHRYPTNHISLLISNCVWIHLALACFLSVFSITFASSQKGNVATNLLLDNCFVFSRASNRCSLSRAYLQNAIGKSSIMGGKLDSILNPSPSATAVQRVWSRDGFSDSPFPRHEQSPPDICPHKFHSTIFMIAQLGRLVTWYRCSTMATCSSQSAIAHLA